ncbi:hypothetical protein RhiJN_14744 [Ceratobasidium sp. AG-Ba]|nr:hypothetical protein RhiJN_14744 [Ceratobasidium sp. AG-Ba]QRW15282.1 hypothetical protein RhiLY_14281 [Ceratobasidium sp. AG-Ba]
MSSFLSELGDQVPLSDVVLPGTHDRLVTPSSAQHPLTFRPKAWRSTVGQLRNANPLTNLSRNNFTPVSEFSTSVSPL